MSFAVKQERKYVEDIVRDFVLPTAGQRKEASNKNYGNGKLFFSSFSRSD